MMFRYNTRVEAIYNFCFDQVLITNIKEIAYFNILPFQIPGCKSYPFFFFQKEEISKEYLSSTILQYRDNQER